MLHMLQRLFEIDKPKPSRRENSCSREVPTKNAPGNQSTITVTDLEAVRFRDTYGDRSGIISWDFHDPLKMWIVRRKSGNTELYKDCHDFNSWTRVDLSELS